MRPSGLNSRVNAPATALVELVHELPRANVPEAYDVVRRRRPRAGAAVGAERDCNGVAWRAFERGDRRAVAASQTSRDSRGLGRDAIIVPSALKATSLALPTESGDIRDCPRLSTSQNLTPRSLLAVASVAPSGLKPTASTQDGCPRVKRLVERSDRDATSQSVTRAVSVTAASVCPSGEKASALTSPPVSRRGAPTGVRSRASQSATPLFLEADRDQPAVRAEPPRVAVEAGRGEDSVVRERERSAKPAVAR